MEAIDLPTVAALLGHSRLDTVRVYSQPDQAALERATAVLETQERPSSGTPSDAPASRVAPGLSRSPWYRDRLEVDRRLIHPQRGEHRASGAAVEPYDPAVTVGERRPRKADRP